MKLKRQGDVLFQWHGLLSVPTSVEPKHGLPSGSQRALARLPSRKRLAKNARSLIGVSRPAVEPTRHCGAAGPSIFSACSLPTGGSSSTSATAPRFRLHGGRKPCCESYNMRYITFDTHANGCTNRLFPVNSRE